MNSALWLPWWRALAGRRAWLAVPIGALLAAVLALDPVLGPEHGFGTYLAYASLFPIALLFRLGRAVDARRADGLEMEEDLRNPRGARAPLAALAAATLALALGLLMFALPPWLLAQRAPNSPPLHTIPCAPPPQELEFGSWTQVAPFRPRPNFCFPSLGNLFPSKERRWKGRRERPFPYSPEK